MAQVTTARVYNWDVHQRRLRQATTPKESWETPIFHWKRWWMLLHRVRFRSFWFIFVGWFLNYPSKIIYWFGFAIINGFNLSIWLLHVTNRYANLPKKQNVSWMSLSCLCETIYNVMIQFFGKIVESWDNYAFAANGLTLFNPDHVSNSSLNLVFRVLSTKAMNES